VKHRSLLRAAVALVVSAGFLHAADAKKPNILIR